MGESVSEETAVDVHESVESVGVTVMDESLGLIDKTVDNVWLNDSALYVAQTIFYKPQFPQLADF